MLPSQIFLKFLMITMENCGPAELTMVERFLTTNRYGLIRTFVARI